MRRLLLLVWILGAPLARAQEDDSNLRAKKAGKGEAKAKAEKDATLTKKAPSVTPDKSLAGDITRKKTNKGEIAPALQYDQFRLGLESQVATKRTEQIRDLKKIIDLTPKESAETPDLLFRLGELYWEESKFYFFQANRKDDDRINAMNRNDKDGEQRAVQEKEELSAQSKEFAQKAVEQYSTIVQNYKNFKRTDEVLYFLGKNLLEAGEDRKALVAFRRLIDKYQKSKFLPDAYLAFAEYYFDTSKGKHDVLEKALENYKNAANYPENQSYGFAIYKQGWCYFNLADYHKAMDQFRAVVLFAQLAGDAAVEKDTGKKGAGKGTLAREARNDFVRAFERAADLGPGDAKAEFAKLAEKPEDRFLMLKQLAGLYYEDGKDREAALSFNMLIKEKPLSPEAPGFQAKIVDCVLRAGNKKMTLQQVRQLVKVIQDVEKSGNVKEDKDKKALAEARELSERTLSNLAVNWHNEAKKTRDDETFALASEVYSDYLALFADSAKAYDLRFFWAELLNDNLQTPDHFEKAAEQYSKVLADDIKKVEAKAKPGKFMVNAAYNAILANDEVVKAAEAAGKLKTQVPEDPTQKAQIPPEKQALLDACERYLKYVPNGDKKVEIAFKAANIYYRHNYLDEAVKRFSDLALNHPEYKFENGDRAGEIAANLVLDSYNLLKDYAKVKEWAVKFYQEPKLATGTFKDYLQKLIPEVTFKLANQLDAKKDYCKAAEAYLGFVGEFPHAEIADKALYNASIDFYNCKQLDKSIAARKRIINGYPKSEFVPACIYSNAEGDEAMAEFDEAARLYEAYAQGFEKSRSAKGKKAAPAAHPAKKGKGGKDAKDAKEGAEEKGAQVWDEGKAQIALYNAGVFREALGDVKRALADRELFLELWPDAPDSEKVQLSIPDLLERAGQFGKAQAKLEDYEKKFSKDPNKILMAEGRIAGLYENKMHRAKEAFRIHERILRYYDSLAQKTKKGLDNTALDAVARAHYVMSEDDFKKFESIKLRWSKLNRLNELKATIKDKAKGLETVQKRYTQTVSFKAGDPAICALYKIGEAYDTFADALVKVPMPKGVPPDLEDAIRQEFGAQSQPAKDKASEAFTAAVQKSRELDVYNDCSNKALARLRDLGVGPFPPMQEEKAEVKGTRVSAQVTGEGILADIEAVPVLSPEQMEENRQKANEIARQTKDLKVKDAPVEPVEKERDVAPTKDELDPTPEAAVAPVPKSQPAGEGDAKKGTTPKKGDEPEDAP